MAQSKILEKQYKQLRSQLCAEISLLLKMHQNIEIEPEIEVEFAPGVDIQDQPQMIQEVGVDTVKVFHYGDELMTVKMEHLSTEVLLNVLKAMEESFEGAKKFLSK